MRAPVRDVCIDTKGGSNMKENQKKYPRTLGDLLSPIKKQLVLTVLLAALGAMCMVVAPLGLTLGVRHLLLGEGKPFVICVAVAGAGIVLNQLFTMISTGYAHVVEVDFRFRLRKAFSEKLTRLPLGWFTQSSSGEIRKLISDDIIKIHTIIAHSFSDAAGAITLPLSCIALMLVYDWRTGLMVLGIILLLFVCGMAWMSKMSVAARSLNEEFEIAQREMSHSVIEVVDGIKEIKNFGLVKSVFGRFDAAVTRFSQASHTWLLGVAKPMSFITSVMQPAVIGFLTLAICLFSLKRGFIGVEGMILYVLLATALPSSLINLATLSNYIRDGLHSANTLLEVYQEADHLYPENPQPLLPGDIVFRDVSFGYTKGNEVLTAIKCTMPRGRVTALVGPSGGGKTTMARLIARFWDVSGGKVMIGGTDVRDFSEEDLLSAISLVFQDVSLMHASVAENIAIARPKASMADIIKAAKGANIHDRIMQLPKGYDSVIGDEGIVLSGGEKQRVTIARAFLADSPIVILDEATAQADAESEAEIQKALSGLSKNKTVVVIAHRLQTIKEAHQILVIDQGQIVESGTHADLVEKAGLYHSMWQAQTGMGGEQ